MKQVKDFTQMDITILERFARADKLESGLYWIAKGLTPVKTQTAFQLARGGRDVWVVDADGTDYLLDDVEMMAEHYPNMSLSYPEIESIFLVEGEL